MSRILVIEDNPQSSRLAAKVLGSVGHTVEIAENAETGLLNALSNPPDLVLLDLGLPDMDGQTVAGVLRQQMAETVIVAFTAWPADTVREMAQAYGCDGVISKPVEKAELLRQVEFFLQNR